MAASNHCLAFVAEERWRHLAAFSCLGRRVDASEVALAWRWPAGVQLVLGPDSTGNVHSPVFGRARRRSLAGSQAGPSPLSARGGATPGIFTVDASWRWCAGGGGSGSSTTSI